MFQYMIIYFVRFWFSFYCGYYRSLSRRGMLLMELQKTGLAVLVRWRQMMVGVVCPQGHGGDCTGIVCFGLDWFERRKGLMGNVCLNDIHTSTPS